MCACARATRPQRRSFPTTRSRWRATGCRPARAGCTSSTSTARSVTKGRSRPICAGWPRFARSLILRSSLAAVFAPWTTSSRRWRSARRGLCSARRSSNSRRCWRTRCARFGAQRIVAGLDARGGKLATHGWQAFTDLDVYEVGQSLRQAGLLRAVYTDIGRDGMLVGVDADGTASLARRSGLSVIASGGVRDLDDIRRLQGPRGAGRGRCHRRSGALHRPFGFGRGAGRWPTG